MRTDLFDYELPAGLVAQTPSPRGESRLLVLHRAQGRIEHCAFRDVTRFLAAGDTLVLNDTRVSARRLTAIRTNGRPAEVFLLRPTGETRWECLARPARPLRPGSAITLCAAPLSGETVEARIVAETAEGGRVIELPDAARSAAITRWGVCPLPPYIRQPLAPDQEERYQTVYAAHSGSAAAPTAGLHFTEAMLEALRRAGIQTSSVTLHVGVGTFRPVRTEVIEAHEMHSEIADLGPESADIINNTAGRVVAVGTTSVRTLETAAAAARTADSLDRVQPFHGATNLFIRPGHRFQAVDAVITNFHLPRSTLLMLVSAFAGREQVLAAYREAVDERYRFFSFGDAMLVL